MIKSGTTYYDERNDRYITPDGTGADPHVWSCIVVEMNEDGEYTITGDQLFTESELSKFKEA